MAGWNGSGTFTNVYNFQADAAAGIYILASRMDTQFANLSAQGFGNTLTRDGQGHPTANLPMAGYRHTGAGAGVADNDYVIVAQVTGGTLPMDVASLTARTGGVTVTAGGVHVTAGGATISAGGVTVATGGVTIGAGGIAVTTGSVQLSPLAGSVGISPGAGNVVMQPGTVGAMDNMVVGGTTARAGTFTTLIANNGTTGSQVVNYSQFPSTQGSTGTMTLPNGVIEKWGTGTTTSGSGAVSFAVAFPTACDNVQLTIASGTVATTLNALVSGTPSTSGFNVYGAAAQSVAFYWRAIGR